MPKFLPPLRKSYQTPTEPKYELVMFTGKLFLIKPHIPNSIGFLHKLPSKFNLIELKKNEKMKEFSVQSTNDQVVITNYLKSNIALKFDKDQFSILLLDTVLPKHYP